MPHRAPHRRIAGAARNGCATPTGARCLQRVRGRNIALASHDDRTEEEIAENAADGIRISEFPVTMAAATAAKAAGMHVIAGAPNIVRGGSHSGNVAAADLLRTRRSGCVRLGLRADQPGRGGVPVRRPASACRAPSRWSPATAGAAGRAARSWPHRHPASALIWCACACTTRLPVVRQVWRAGERVA